MKADKMVSIHAPVGGATFKALILGTPLGFQSTRLWEARLIVTSLKRGLRAFQSTRLWEARPK